MSGRLRLWIVALVSALLLLSCGGPSASTVGPHLENVSAAPDFSAPDETGKLRSLSEFRGRALVLYFYPKDGTPGCTKEACAFRDAWDRLREAGAAVVGVSVDSVASHAAFKRTHSLPFPLLSDPEGKILSAYGVPTSPQGYAARTTFIIDSRGMIRRIFPEVDPAVHVEEVLPVLSQLAQESMTGKQPRAPDAPPSPPPAATKEPAPPTPPTTAVAPSGLRAWVIFLEPVRPEMATAPTKDEEAKVSAHFEYLKRLQAEGILVLAGPSLEPPQIGLVIFRAVDRAQAERILADDPAVAGGVFRARMQELKLSLLGELK